MSTFLHMIFSVFLQEINYIFGYKVLKLSLIGHLKILQDHVWEYVYNICSYFIYKTQSLTEKKIRN